MWTKAHEARYQAGRCDAHGNRMIAFDIWYLRGYFAAFLNMDGKNPYIMAEETGLCPLDRINWRRAVIHIDRQVNEFIDIRKLRRSEIAFERGKDVL